MSEPSNHNILRDAIILVLGGMLTIAGGFFQQWYSAYLLQKHADQAVQWMLSLDIERLRLLQGSCEDVRRVIALYMSESEEEQLKTLFAFDEFPNIDFLQRYEPYANKVRDPQVRVIIGKLATLSVNIEMFNRFAKGAHDAVEQGKKGIYASFAPTFRDNYKANLRDMAKHSITIHDDAAHLAVAIDGLVNRTFAVIEYPFEMVFPAQYVSYTTSLSSRAFELSQDYIARDSIDSVVIAFQSPDSCTSYVYKNGRRILFRGLKLPLLKPSSYN